MQSKAKTAQEYLASLPEDRRHAVSAVRKTILKHLPKGYEEGMLYGMLCYYIPLSRYPNTYNKQPMMLAGTASQKNYLSLHLLCVYSSPVLLKRLKTGFEKQNKKLDMGKGCIRFKRSDDLALDVIGEMIGELSVDDYIKLIEKIQKER